MDSQQSFPFDWGDNHEPAYNQQLHDILGGPPQPASSSSTFEAPFQNPFRPGMVDDLQPDNDISMKDNEAQPESRSSRRVRGENLDWNAYKDAIWTLYIDQNKSLSETMQAMDDLHSFKAS